MELKVFLWLAVASLILTMHAHSAAPVASEEFVGPLPSWKNLRTDYGAVGDGKADDTAALEAGLGALAQYGKAKPGDPYVLYLPAGTYRITKPMVLVNCMNISILGEDPTTTKILYDGPPDESILTLNGVSYSKFGRITWDGQGKASAAVAHQWNPVKVVGPAGTFLDHTDEVFQDVKRGIIGGLVVNGDHGMDAECTIKRCKFIRCSEAGLSIQSFNALDWWVWDSEFVDCEVGATNWYGGGHFHLYRNVFRRSKTADIRIAVGSYFGIRFNTSIESNRFIDPCNGQDSVVGNKIINPISPTPIKFPGWGPLVLLDNIFVQKPEGNEPVVYELHPGYINEPTNKGGGDCLAFGNQFYGASGIQAPNLIESNNQTLDYDAAKADWTNPPMLPTAPRVNRKVFAVKPGASGAEIQAAIDNAVKLTGQKPVVYLPSAEYHLDSTLHIPPNSDLQIIGDGGQTQLIWEGKDGDTVIQVDGPTRVTLRDFYVTGLHSSKWAKPGHGIVFTNVDQPGGLIFLDQAAANDCIVGGMFFDGLGKTHVEAIGSQAGSTQTGIGIKVKGVGKDTPWIGFFGSAGSNNKQTDLVENGGNLMVWDTWYETAVSTPTSEPRYIHLTDQGNLTFFGGHIATIPSKDAPTNIAAIDLDGFRGNVTLLNTAIDNNNPIIRLAGTGEGLKFLAYGIDFGWNKAFPRLTNDAPQATAEILSSRPTRDNDSTPDTNFIAQMLVPAQTVEPSYWAPAPEGATDLRIHRVQVGYNVGIGLSFLSGNAPTEN